MAKMPRLSVTLLSGMTASAIKAEEPNIVIERLIREIRFPFKGLRAMHMGQSMFNEHFRRYVNPRVWDIDDTGPIVTLTRRLMRNSLRRR